MIAALVIAWRLLAPGVEYAQIDSLRVVRIDSQKARLVPLSGPAQPARKWLDSQGLLAVINAGMYEKDIATHTGYFQIGARVLNPVWRADYSSALVLDASGAAQLIDASSKPSADSVIQSLRLIKSPGESVWTSASAKKWSEAAIAADSSGRILFLLCRAPFSMHDLNAWLLSLPLGIVRAMHVEGGPEASLSVRGIGDFEGSYETAFHENDDNKEQWPLPNVLGVIAR
jgi:hypothetical protein